MAKLNALTREQLVAALDLIDKMQDLPASVTRLEVNFGSQSAGTIVRDDTELVFIPAHKEPIDPFGR